MTYPNLNGDPMADAHNEIIDPARGTTSSMTLVDAALKYVRSGISVIPVLLSTKAPLGPWKKSMEMLPTEVEIFKNFGSLDPQFYGIGRVCGRVSGNMEMLDFDNKCANAQEIFDRFMSTPEVVAIFARHAIPYESSPSGGFHIWYRSQSQVEKNQKLAFDSTTSPDGEIKEYCTVETRGEGGYGICGPSKGYEMMNGSFFAVPTISEEERDTLLSVARSFNTVIEFDTSNVRDDADSQPGNEYSNDPANMEEVLGLLLDAGWTSVRREGEAVYLCRPGKALGISAVLRPTHFLVWTTNAPPFGAKGHKFYSIFGLLKHGGDFKAAARELRSRGLGGVGKEERQTGFIRAYAGRNGTQFEIRYDIFIDMLNEAGFRSYPNKDDVKIVKVIGNIVEEKFFIDIIDFAKASIIDGKEDGWEEKLSYMGKNDQKLFTENKVKQLMRLPDDFNRSTATEVYLYFRNGALKITKEQPYQLLDYTELPKPVWREKIIDRDIDVEFLSKFAGGAEIETFMRHVTGESDKKMDVLVSITGFLLSDYKDPANARAVVLTDEELPEVEEAASGGTGKSLFVKYIGYYRNVAPVGGKAADFASPFFYQNVEHSTDIILFDDVARKFPLENIFTGITGPLTVEKKNKQSEVIPFERSPKIVITTNYSIQGIGRSFTRRMAQFAFAPYYNDERSPEMEFGHLMFIGWDKMEWMRSDAFIAMAIQFFLDHGLRECEEIQVNTRLHQCMDAISHDFFEFMMEQIDRGNIQTNVEFDRKALFEEYKEAIGDSCDEKFHTFTKNLTKFGLILKLKGKHRRSSGRYYSIFKGNLIALLAQYRTLSGAEG